MIKIAFNEFIMACSLTSRVKSKDKLKISLQVYDSDTSALLGRDEMQKIIEAVIELYEGVPISKDDSMRKVDTIIDKFDRNKSGSVTKIEFIEGVSNDPQLAAFINRQDSSKSFKLENASR